MIQGINTPVNEVNDIIIVANSAMFINYIIAYRFEFG